MSCMSVTFVSGGPLRPNGDIILMPQIFCRWHQSSADSLTVSTRSNLWESDRLTGVLRVVQLEGDITLLQDVSTCQTPNCKKGCHEGKNTVFYKPAQIQIIGSIKCQEGSNLSRCKPLLKYCTQGAISFGVSFIQPLI